MITVNPITHDFNCDDPFQIYTDYDYDVIFKLDNIIASTEIKFEYKINRIEKYGEVELEFDYFRYFVNILQLEDAETEDVLIFSKEGKDEILQAIYSAFDEWLKDEFRIKIDI